MLLYYDWTEIKLAQWNEILNIYNWRYGAEYIRINFGEWSV